MGTTVGVDIGGSLLRAARLDDDLTILERVESPTPTEEGSDAIVDRIIALIEQVLPEDPDDLQGVGVGVPGPMRVDEGLVLETPNLPWKDLPLGPILSDAIGVPVRLGNDADVAGLAEFRLGAGKGTRHMVYMTISTGIGGGIINDGKLVTGGGLGGEVGHLVLEPDGPLCGCGQRGHLEALGSGTAIERMARERLEAGEKSSVRNRAKGDLGAVTSAIVGEAALDGDALAVELMQTAGRYIGIGIASLMHLLNPQMFVLGGGVTHVGDLLFDAINEAVHDYAMHPRFIEDAPIVKAQLAADVGLKGAALLVGA